MPPLQRGRNGGGKTYAEVAGSAAKAAQHGGGWACSCGEQRNFASRTACRQCGKARSAPKQASNKQEEVHEVVKTLRRELAAERQKVQQAQAARDAARAAATQQAQREPTDEGELAQSPTLAKQLQDKEAVLASIVKVLGEGHASAIILADEVDELRAEQKAAKKAKQLPLSARARDLEKALAKKEGARNKAAEALEQAEIAAAKARSLADEARISLVTAESAVAEAASQLEELRTQAPAITDNPLAFLPADVLAKLDLSTVGALTAAVAEADKDKAAEAETAPDAMEEDDEASTPTTALARQVLSIVPAAKLEMVRAAIAEGIAEIQRAGSEEEERKAKRARSGSGPGATPEGPAGGDGTQPTQPPAGPPANPQSQPILGDGPPSGGGGTGSAGGAKGRGPRDRSRSRDGKDL